MTKENPLYGKSMDEVLEAMLNTPKRSSTIVQNPHGKVVLNKEESRELFVKNIPLLKMFSELQDAKIKAKTFEIAVDTYLEVLNISSVHLEPEFYEELLGEKNA